MTNIYSFWISGELQDVNKLCIKSVQENGHKLIIYSYIPLDVKCEVRDAREILPESEIYYYKHFSESFKFGGIAERLKAEMLHNLGGMHIDLDVVLLKPLQFDTEYAFRPHPQGIVCNFVKAPAKSEFTKFYVDWTKAITSENKDWELSFKGLIQFLDKNPELKQYIQPIEELGSDLPEYWQDFIITDREPSESLKMIHMCNAIQLCKDYKKGSFYEKLLIKYKI